MSMIFPPDTETPGFAEGMDPAPSSSCHPHSHTVYSWLDSENKFKNYQCQFQTGIRKIEDLVKTLIDGSIV